MEDNNKEGYIYVPYIPITKGTYINGVKVWDLYGGRTYFAR